VFERAEALRQLKPPLGEPLDPANRVWVPSAVTFELIEGKARLACCFAPVLAGEFIRYTSEAEFNLVIAVTKVEAAACPVKPLSGM
jgi:hypothetical protein